MTRLHHIASVLLLSACSSAAVPEIYRLEGHIVPGDCRGTSGITIHSPQASPGLDSAHIAVVDQPQHLSYYRGVAWSAPLPAMLQAYFVEAFAQSHRFTGAAADGEAVPARWAFDTSVRHFEVDQSGPQRILKLQIAYRLRPADSRQVTAQQTLSDEVNVSGKSIDEIVQQMNQSLDALTQQFLQKTGCR